jgi:FkbM family methyltransferase
MSLKNQLQQLLFPIGTNQKILIGPLKKYKYKISPNSGWAPILGRWEPHLQELFSKIIQQGNTVFDLGANIGIHTLLAAKLVGENGKVVAFEPFKDNIEELNSNLKMNNLNNFIIAPYAVSNTNGKAIFNIGLHNKQGSLFDIGNKSGKEIEIETITLDEYINKTGNLPDFIKIDIEGAESSALEGFEKNIIKSWPTMIIELHTSEQDKKVGEFLKKIGYIGWRICENNKLKLAKIKNFDLTYPDPDGIWGHVFTYHESRLSFIEKALKL